MFIRHVSILCALALLPLLHARPADACSCGREGMRTWPAKGQDAPTNTRIWIRFSSMDRLAFDSLLHEGNERPQRSTFALWTGGAAKEVAVVEKRSYTGEMTLVELRPKKPLRPKTRYRVVHRLQRGDQVFEEVLSTFTTTAGPDHTGPVWEDVGVHASYYWYEQVCCLCGNGQPYIEIRPDPLVEATLYAIWVSRGERIDFDRPPDAYARASYGTLALGSGSVCRSSNFAVPPTLPKLLLGIRAMDVAGNFSEPWRVTVPAGKRKKESPVKLKTLEKPAK